MWESRKLFDSDSNYENHILPLEKWENYKNNIIELENYENH